MDQAVQEKEGKDEEGYGRWGTLATVRETTEEGDSPR